MKRFKAGSCGTSEECKTIPQEKYFGRRFKQFNQEDHLKNFPLHEWPQELITENNKIKATLKDIHTKQYKKDYRESHKEEIAKCRKQWKRNNPEKVMASKVKYKQINPELVKEHGRSFYERHTEERKEFTRKYYKEHKEEILEKAKCKRQQLKM